MNQELIDRMVAFIRGTAAGPSEKFTTIGAKEILALIDPPVDPDLLAARRLAADFAIECGYQHSAENLLAGGKDEAGATRYALLGIKYGRAHALSDLMKLPDDEARAEEIWPGIYAPSDQIKKAIAAGIAYGRAGLEVFPPMSEVPPMPKVKPPRAAGPSQDVLDLTDAREIVAQILENNTGALREPGEAKARAAQVRCGIYDLAFSVPMVLKHLQGRRTIFTD